MMNDVGMTAGASVEPVSGSKTLSGLLRDGVRLLSDAGVEHADHETAWILEFVLGASRVDLCVEGGRRITPSEWTSAMDLLKRRAMREPLQYILGTQEFCGLDFEVAPGVLIPRPETELLIEEVARGCAAFSSPRMADIGTGSGCIAVGLAKRLPAARLYAVDLSEAAIGLARRNAFRHAVENRLTFLHGDLFEPLDRLGLRGRLAAVVSNPPYIADGDFATLPPEVAEYEPKLALSGGPDGLSIYRRLLRDALEYLIPGGLLVLEMGYGQADHVRQLTGELHGDHPVRTLTDQAGIERVLTLTKKTALSF